MGSAGRGGTRRGERWEVRHTETTAATPAEVWTWYEDVDRWHRWDGGITAVELHGPFASGTRGRVTLPNGRRGRLTLAAVEPRIAFTDVVRLPLLRVTTRHTLEPADLGEGGGTRITHAVQLNGTLALFFPRLMSVPVRRALPTSVAQLAFLAAREPAR